MTPVDKSEWWNREAWGHAVVSLLVVLSLASPTGILAQEEADRDRPESWHEMLGQFELTVESFKSHYELGEPVYLVVRLHNHSSRAVRLPAHLHPSEGELSIVIRRPDGERMVFHPLVVTDSEDPPPTVPAGEQAAVAFPVFFGSAGWTFVEVGEHLVQITYGDGSPPAPGSTVSDTMIIGIRGSETGGEALTSGEPASLQAGKFMTWGAGDHLQAGRDLMLRIRREYPESLLANYLRYYEAHRLSWAFTDYGAGEVRRADPEAAMRLFERVDAYELPRVLRIQLWLSEEANMVRLGRIEATLERLDLLREDIGDDPAYRPFLERALRIEEGLGAEGGPTSQVKMPGAMRYAYRR